MGAWLHRGVGVRGEGLGEEGIACMGSVFGMGDRVRWGYWWHRL